MRQKKFTAIELIAVVVAIGILAAMIYVKVASLKDEAIKSAVESNITILQSAVDKFALDHDGSLPTAMKPYLGDPQTIQYDKLYPKYIEKKPDTKLAYYWIDYQGKVWGSTIDGPDSLIDEDEFFYWTDSGKVVYRIYEEIEDTKVASTISKLWGAVTNSNSTPYKELKNIKYDVNNGFYKLKKENNTHYYIQGYDYLDLPTPLFNPNYQGYPIKDDFGYFLPINDPSRSYFFTVNAKEKARWLGIEKSEIKPTGTDILYEFATSDDGKVYAPYIKDFSKVKDSQYIKVKVTLVPKGKVSPTLESLKIKFKTLRELQAEGVTLSDVPLTDSVGNFDNIVVYDHFAGNFYPPNNYTPGGGTTNPVTPVEPDPTYSYYEYERGSDFYSLSPNQTYGSFTKTFYTGGPVRSFSDLIANTNTPDGTTITYSFQSSIDGINFTEPTRDIREVPNGSYIKVTVEMSRETEDILPPSISDMIVVFDQPKSVQLPVPQTGDWITVNQLFYQVDAEKVGDWISSEIYDDQPTGTRIQYIYSTSEDGKKWANHNTDITKVPNSRYLNVNIVLQVQPNVKVQPTFFEIMVNYKVDEEEQSNIISGNNRDLIQQAVDKYYQDKKEYPTFEQPVIYVPDTINFNKLNNGYLNMKFEAENAFYWVDYKGKVWISSVDSPKNLSSMNRVFTWSSVEGAQYYKIYKEENGEFKFVTNVTKGTTYNIPDNNEKYFVGSVDTYGNVSAPVGIGYEGYTGNCTVQGKGTLTEPFVVCSEETFNDIRKDMYAHYVLTRNLDLTDFNDGKGFTPFGSSSLRFSGTFDGQGNTIEGIKITSTNSHVGIFSSLNSNASIKNLSIENATVKGAGYVGILAGSNYGAKLENIRVNGVVDGTSSYVGGVTGYNTGVMNDIGSNSVVTSPSNYAGGISGFQSNTVSKSYFYGNVKGSSYTGGLFGQLTSTLTRSFSIGKVEGLDYVGGLVGYNSSSSLSNAYSLGMVKGRYDVGGLIGLNSSTPVSKTLSRTKVSNTLLTEDGNQNRTGGLIGRSTGGNITDSYYDAYYSTRTISGGGTPSNINKMVKQITYQNWDFTNTWNIVEGKSVAYLKDMPQFQEVLTENMPTDYEPFSQGSGTEADPYIITSEIQLDNVRYELNAHYKLGKDITLTKFQTGEGWSPIGTVENPFRGSFDGNNFAIKNLFISRNANDTGLFGYTNTGTVIKNLKIENAQVKGNLQTGILAGQSRSTIENVIVQGTVEGVNYTAGLTGWSYSPIKNSSAVVTVKGQSYTGGLVGQSQSTIESSFAKGEVSGTGYTGGLTGVSNAAVSKSYSTANVKGTSTHVGGLIGQSNSSISLSYAVGSVQNTGSYTGGLAGYQNSNSIQNSFALGDVTGANFTGGLVGQMDNTTLSNVYVKQKLTSSASTYKGGIAGHQTNTTATNTYWDSHSSGMVTTANRLGIGLNTSSMFKQEQFGGFNFTTIWEIKEGQTIPYLKGLPIPEKAKKENIVYSFNGFPDGIGTITDPFVIETEEQLDNIRYQLDSHYVLANDIEMKEHQSDLGWDPIGSDANAPFNGSFNGQNHTISKLFINRPTENYNGLFGYMSNVSGAAIKNLTMDSVTITGQHYNGSVVGYSSNLLEKLVSSGTIKGMQFTGGIAGQSASFLKNSSSTAVITATSTYAGGLVGFANGQITDSFSKGNVTGTSYVGGLVGQSYNLIKNSYSHGNVKGSSNTIGGLAGYASSSLDTVYAIGNVEGNNEVGGLVGYLNSGSIQKAFATGTVKGNSVVAGLVGQLTNSGVSYSYAVKKVEASNGVSGGLVAQSNNSNTNNSYWDSYTTTQLKSQGGVGSNTLSMFRALRYANWDFTNTWVIDENLSTPYFKNLEKPVEVTKEDINSDFEPFSGGTGTVADPYLIENENQLNNMRYELDVHYKQVQDITLTSYQTGSGWLPVGDSITNFLGTFEGDNHTIENLFINRTTNDNGLFGQTSSTSRIQNLTLKNPSVTGSFYVGSLVGNNRAKVSNITVDGNVKGSTFVGGLFGMNNGSIENVNSTVKVIGTSSSTGGIIGSNSGPLKEIHVETDVVGVSTTGGIVGSNSQSISNSYFKGTVKAQNMTGGLVGSTSHIITKSYVLGDVTGANNTGGLAGSSSSDVTISYFEGNVSGNNKVGGLIGGKTSSKVENTFSLGTVKGASEVGGIIGAMEQTDNGGGALFKSFARNKVTATGAKGGLIGTNPYRASSKDSYWDGSYTQYWRSEGGMTSHIYSMIQKKRYPNWDFNAVWDMTEKETLPYLRELPMPEQLNFDKAENNMKPYEGGDGSLLSPYQIKDEEQLNNVRWELDTHYVLINDITLTQFQTGSGFEPIGNNHTPFEGTLEGSNTVLENLFVNSTTSYTGLFGETKASSVIQNLTLKNLSVKGSDYTGGLVGNNYGSIQNITLSGIVDGNMNVGGLAGWSQNSIKQIDSSVKVSGVGTVGGLIGYSRANLEESYSIGDVFSSGSGNGGLAGRQAGGYIKNAFALGKVEGANQVGGLVGVLSSSMLENSYSKSSSVKSVSDLAGGLVGNISSSVVNNSYWDASTSGAMATANRQGTGLNTIYMFNADRYTAWDTNEVWTIEDGQTLPYLRNLIMPVEVKRENMTIDFLGFESGTGTVADPYYISTEQQLNHVKYELEGNFVLMNDIQLVSTREGNGFIPIGNNITPFNGSFDGNNFTISDLVINTATTDYVGLFGKTSNTADIRNLKLLNADIKGEDYTGAIIGLSDGTASNLDVQGQISGRSYVGGIIGRMNKPITNMRSDVTITSNSNYSGGISGYSYSTIDNVYSKVAMTSAGYSGGITGHAYNNVSNAHSEVAISSTGSYVGGVVGSTRTAISDSSSKGTINTTSGSYIGGLVGQANSTISNSNTDVIIVSGGSYVGGLTGYANSQVTSSNAIGNVQSTGSYIGGLVGHSRNTVSDSYADGDVKGHGYVGGLVGQAYSGTITNSHATGDVTSPSNGQFVGGLIGAGLVSGVETIYDNSSTASINNSYATGNVTTGGSYFGGLAGRTDNTITNSYAAGNIKGASHGGGLVGYGRSTINTSYATGNVEGTFRIGGLVGYEYKRTEKCRYSYYYSCDYPYDYYEESHINNYINDSFATGNVKGTSEVGGLVGYMDRTQVNRSYSIGTVTGTGTNNGGLIGYQSRSSTSNSYWDKDTSLKTTSAGGTYKTTAQMKTKSTFSGWDFTNVWLIEESKSYPYLKNLTKPQSVGPIIEPVQQSTTTP